MAKCLHYVIKLKGQVAKQYLIYFSKPDDNENDKHVSLFKSHNPSCEVGTVIDSVLQ